MQPDHTPRPSLHPAITISCDTCVMQFSAHCADCIVTHVVSPAPSEQLYLTDEEVGVMARLVRAGLVPTLLHRGQHDPEPVPHT